MEKTKYRISQIQQFLRERIKILSETSGVKAPVFLAYFSTVYFVEILYTMLMLLLLYGRTVAFGTALILSLLLSFHIIGLYFMKKRNRVIQLFLMDIHIAFTAGYLINRLMGDFSLSGADQFMLVFRLIAVMIEIPLVLIFTGDSASELYN